MDGEPVRVIPNIHWVGSWHMGWDGCVIKLRGV